MAISQPQRGRRRPSARLRPWFVPRLLRLEDRIVPNNQFELAGLRFLATTDFVQNGNEHKVTSGSVSIGYMPAGAENFLPLIRADLSNASSEFIIENNPGAPKFNVRAAPLLLVVVGGTPSIPIPIWQPNGTFILPVDINQLTGSGFAFSPPNTLTLPFQVSFVDFKLSQIGFANPNGGNTTDSQVKFQGSATFDRVPLLATMGVSVNVTGNDYVIAQRSGIDLTGLDVHYALPTTATIAGMKVSGEIDIGYSHVNNVRSFSFDGGVMLTSEGQDSSGNATLDNVRAQLDLTYANGTVSKLGFGVSGQFRILGLTVSTVQSQPLAFNFNFPQAQYEISGGLQLEFNENILKADFGKVGAPGIIIKDSKLHSLNASLQGQYEFSKATISTTGPNGLQFIYNRIKEQFEMGGGLMLSIPTGESTQSISATLLDPSGGPGLIIQSGRLKQLDMQLSGGFSIFDLKASVQNAGIQWQRADNTLLISGTFVVDFDVFQTSLTLGTGTNPGLKIHNGRFSVESVNWKVTGAEIGPVTLRELKVSYKADGNSFDLAVHVDLTLPGGIMVGGEFDLVKGRLDTISIDISPPPGILEIPDTGLSIIDMHVKVTNIENPASIVVTGGLAVVWGERISMLGQKVYVFRAEGDVTADANELIIEAQAQLGAYSDDNGTTWQGVLGDGDAKLTLDWQDNFYALHVEVDGLLAVFDIEGDLVFAAGRDIALLAEATVVIPNEVPFIGGDKLGGFGFFFEHVFPENNVTSTTFAAWIELDIIWTFTVGFEYVIDSNGNKSFHLIGGSQVAQFQAAVHPLGNQTFRFTYRPTTGTGQGQIPPAATSLVLSADWSQSAPGVTLNGRPVFHVQKFQNGTTTTYEEAQFAANGISFISDAKFNGPTKGAIQIVGSTTDQYATLAAQYTLLVDITTQGGNPFPHYPNPGFADALKIQSTYHIPKPVFGPPTMMAPYAPPVPTAPTGPFSVTVLGAIDEGLFGQAKVSLYRVLLSDPFRRGVLVGSSPLTGINPPVNGQNWQATFTVPIDGLYPTAYALYALIDDGFNVPVLTILSAPFTPNFAVEGLVSNQNQDAKAGWSVYLDYDRNGKRDDNEPLSVTNMGGFYGFTRTFDPRTGWARVPTGVPFDVRLIAPAPSHFAPVGVPRVTFDGTHTLAVPFALREKSAIQGTVFVDQDNDGITANGTPAAGAVAYLDLNGNSRRDPDEPSTVADAAGRYDFANQPAGTYTVALDLTSLSHTTPTAAYAVPAGTVGTQTLSLAVGMEFNVNRPIEVTSLGVFDSGQNGLRVPITAILYDRTTQVAVARLVFNTGTGTLVGGSRFLPLANPITLLPGFQGLIVAEGYGPQEPWGSAGTNPAWKTFADVGTLTFLGTGVSGPIGQYPNFIGDNFVPNPYAAGSLLFREPSWVQTGDTPATYRVTINGSGFDVQEGKDFGVLPPAYIAGTVTGYGLGGSITSPYYGAVNAGGTATSRGYQADGYFTGGQTFSSTNAIDTGGVTDPAPAAVYQTYRGSFSPQFSYALPGLVPGAAYAVRLHFAETAWTRAGQRKFNVAINGRQVLSDFDILAAAGRMNAAVVETFATFADSSGTISVVFSRGSVDNPIVCGIEVIQQAAVATNAGGGETSGNQIYQADRYFTGGQTFSSTNAIDRSGVTDPAPVAVYQTYRGSFSPQFSYDLPGLVPGAAYAVRLHFAETAWTRAGQRKFNVAINGRQVLADFDIFAAAGRMNAAVIETFATFADASGTITVVFSRGSADNPIVCGIEAIRTNTPLAGWTVQLLGDVPAAQIDVGGGGRAGYGADTDFRGGAASVTTAAIDTSRVFDAAPMAVYQSGRRAATGSFTYAIPGLTPGVAYVVRLHFAETFWSGPGQRKFDVAINGVQVFDEFDIFANAGGANTAIVQGFTAVADTTGALTIAFTNGSADEAYVNAIEVLRPNQVVATTTTDVQGNYIFNQPTPGQYTVREVPPAGWRQLAPFYSDLRLTPTPLPAGAVGDYPFATADFNGDGHVDIALSADTDPNFNYPLTVYYNSGNGTFGSGYNYANPINGGLNTIAADLNGDRLIDIAILNYPKANPLSVFLNTGNSNLQQRFQYAPGFWTFAFPDPPNDLTLDFRAGDFNADGLDDLVLSYQNTAAGTAALALLLNAAEPAGRTVVTYALPHDSFDGPTVAGGVAVGDVNGDGRLDVVVNGGGANATFAAINVALGDGRGGLAPWMTYEPFNFLNGGPVALADVRGTGSLDAVPLGYVVSDDFYVVAFGQNRGTGIFDFRDNLVDSTKYPANPLPISVSVEDLNGDLKPDLALVLTNPSGNNAYSRLVVFLNTGSDPYFEPATALTFLLPPGVVARNFAVADVNNDGLADVIVTGRGAPGVVFINQSPQNQPGVPVFVSAGQVAGGADFVNVQKPQQFAVHGQVFEDVNRNGRRDTGETGAAGWFAFVDLNRNRRYDVGEPSEVTRAHGAYAISGLAAGTYAVGVVPEDRWKTSSPAAEFVEVTVDGQSAAQADFGLARRLVELPTIPSIPAGQTIALPLNLTAAAGERRLVWSLEAGAPAGATIDRVTGTFTWTPPRRLANGTYRVTVRVQDPFEPTFTETASFDIPVTPAVTLLAVGANTGQLPLVQVYNADGSVRFQFLAFSPSFRGGVHVATGDVTGDGIPDVITGAGAGGGPHVKIYDGATGAIVREFFAYDTGFLGGVFVAAGDVTGDGRVDVITGAGAGGGPHVQAFDGATGAVVRSFMAYSPAFAGGVSVAAGDVTGDGRVDVVTGAGAGGGPHVRAFDVATNTVVREFFAYDAAFRGGVFVATGYTNGDGRAMIVTGAGVGGGPHVKVYDAVTGALLTSFLENTSSDRSRFPPIPFGVRVSTADLNGDGQDDLITSVRTRGLPQVVGRRGSDLALVATFNVGNPAFLGGVFVG